MVSLYLDAFKTIDDMIDAYKSLSIRRTPLRNIEGLNIYNLDEEQYNETLETFKKERVRFSLVDIDIKYGIYHDLDLDKISKISKDFGTREVVMNLPSFIDFEAEKNELVNTIKKLISDLRRLRVNVSFHINYEINSAYIAFLIKEINNLNFMFNPGKCFEHEKSITTYYRLLRRRITNVSLYDVDENKRPTLLGYGKALILDTIDKLNIDRFRGDIYYDFNLADYVKTRTTEKRGFFSRVFRIGRKKEKAHQKIDERLKIDEDSDVDILDILDQQLKLIRKYQKS